MAGMHLQLVQPLNLSSTSISLGCGLHEVMTAGEQALVLDTVWQNFVIPAISSEIVAAHSGSASITVSYGCQWSYLHGDPIQQQAAPLSGCHTLRQTAILTPGC